MREHVFFPRWNFDREISFFFYRIEAIVVALRIGFLVVDPPLELPEEEEECAKIQNECQQLNNCV